MTIRFMPHVTLTGFLSARDPVSLQLFKGLMPVREIEVQNRRPEDPRVRYEMLWTDNQDSPKALHEVYHSFRMSGQCGALKTFITLASRLGQVARGQRLQDYQAVELSRQVLAESRPEVIAGGSLMIGNMPTPDMYSRRSGFWLAKSGYFRDLGDGADPRVQTMVKFEAVGKEPVSAADSALLVGARLIAWDAGKDVD